MTNHKEAKEIATHLPGETPSRRQRSITFAWRRADKTKEIYINMLKQKAGEVAGKIWNYLHANENQDLETLKNAIGEKDEYLYMAIGWLLRENKIVGDNGKLNLR